MENQENESLTPIEYVAVAGGAVAAGAVAAGSIAGKKAGIFTGITLAGAFLGSYLTSSFIQSNHKSEIDAMQKKNSALVEKVQSSSHLFPTRHDNTDYITIVSPHSTNYYQLITNSQGNPLFVPIEQIHSNALEALAQEQKETLQKKREILDSKNSNIINYLNTHLK